MLWSAFQFERVARTTEVGFSQTRSRDSSAQVKPRITTNCQFDQTVETRSDGNAQWRLLVIARHGNRLAGRDPLLDLVQTIVLTQPQALRVVDVAALRICVSLMARHTDTRVSDQRVTGRFLAIGYQG